MPPSESGAAHAGTNGPAESIRDRLRRYGAAGRPAGTAGAATAADVLAPPADFAAGKDDIKAAGTDIASRPARQGDGLEVLRMRLAPDHHHGRRTLGHAIETLGASGEAEGTIWLDTETTGLAGGTGTYAFLVGLAYLEGGALVVEQLLMRRLSAECHLLDALGQRLGAARRLVTFNGRRFDWPILEARYVLARRRPAAPAEHTDLIYPARWLWHRVFGTHRLSLLEAEVLGAPRSDDIPGWEIPMRYVRYLRSTDRASLDPIVTHNRADLVALVLLHGEVVRVLDAPHAADVPLDWEGAGVLLGRQGAHREAVACFTRAAQDVGEARDRWRLLRRLAKGYRAAGDPEGAGACWEAEAAVWRSRDRLRAHVLEEVAKWRGRRGDGAGARAAAEEALAIAEALTAAAGPASRAGTGPPAGMSGLADRLRGRVARLRQRHG